MYTLLYITCLNWTSKFQQFAASLVSILEILGSVKLHPGQNQQCTEAASHSRKSTDDRFRHIWV